MTMDMEADLTTIPVQPHTVTLLAAVGVVDVGQRSCTAPPTCLIAWGTLPGGGVEVCTQGTTPHTPPHNSTILTHFYVEVAA